MYVKETIAISLITHLFYLPFIYFLLLLQIFFSCLFHIKIATNIVCTFTIYKKVNMTIFIYL
jgi:hypothetical protein